MKTSKNDVQYSNSKMGEMDKYQELYSRQGDNSSRFEGKTVAMEHTLSVYVWQVSQNKRKFIILHLLPRNKILTYCTTAETKYSL